MKDQCIKFEIYTLHPETKDIGYDIKWVVVYGVSSIEDAKEKIKLFPDFDCIRESYYLDQMSDSEIANYRDGRDFVELSHDNKKIGSHWNCLSR